MRFNDEERALLAAIHEAPRDDTQLLVYANWLEEHGEREYAEYIRLRIQFAVLMNEASLMNDKEMTIEDRYRDVCSLAEGERFKYLESISDAWAEPLPPFATSLSYNRGLFFVKLPRDIGLAEASAAIETASPRLRYSIALYPETPPGLLDLIATGRVASVYMHPSKTGPQLHIRDRFAAGAIELMRRLFASPHILRLESVTIVGASVLTEEARSAWYELAPSKFPAPWTKEF